MKHIFYPAENPIGTLILLHGTGGDEESLVPIAKSISEDMNCLGIRGNISENGMNRFFKRVAEGIFDFEDLKFRTEELSVFIKDSAEKYQFSLETTYFVGYSNGANIAANVLLQKQDIVNGAILFHPMVPCRDVTYVMLKGKSVFISAGTNDPIVPNSEVEELQEILMNMKAFVEVHWESNGHSISSTEIKAAKMWLAKQV